MARWLLLFRTVLEMSNKSWRPSLQKVVSGLLSLGLLLAKPCLASGPPPVITVQPVSLNVPLLGIATFSVTASSGTTLSYQWYKDGSTIPGATSSTYSILTVLGSSAGTYAVLVSNAGGSIMSANATLNLGYPPTITAQPLTQTAVQGQTVSFSVSASGSSPWYQWYFNGAPLKGTGATKPAMTLTSVTSSQAGNYFVVVSDAAGSVTSVVASLTVLVAPSLQVQPASQSVVQGQAASFSTAVTGTAPLSYQWIFKGSPLKGATTSALALTNVQPSDAGSYALVVTNIAGSITSSAATLTVTPLPSTLSLTSTAVSSPAGFAFQLSVPAGYTCVIMASTDCQSWTPIATNVTTTGTVSYSDPAATNYPQRFYRAVVH